MSALITSKQLNKVCVLCSAIGPEGFLFDWFGDIQPKIVRLNLRLGQTHLLIMKNCLKELKLETTFAVFMFSCFHEVFSLTDSLISERLKKKGEPRAVFYRT